MHNISRYLKTYLDFEIWPTWAQYLYLIAGGSALIAGVLLDDKLQAVGGGFMIIIAGVVLYFKKLRADINT